MKKYICIFISSCSFNTIKLNAQYISTDKGGYTNVRKEPNSKSEIVEKVVKYQVFYSAEDIPCYDLHDPNIRVGNWLQVSTDMLNGTGYIYIKNIYPVDKLPVLCGEKEFEGNSFRCSNDSIELLITKQDYNPHNKLDGKRMYGTDGWIPYKEIKEIIVTYKGKKMYVPENKFKNYYDVGGYISVWIGFDGELYLSFGGGDGSGGYGVMLTILNGDIVHSIVSEC